MWQGQVEAIYITGQDAKPMESKDEVPARAGKGLEGDRYFTGDGTFSKKPDPGRNITLIEREAIESAEAKYGVDLSEGAPRRNIQTRGVPLNHLVGKEFLIGDVRVKGVKLCEPCGHLESLTEPGVKQALIHRGGLRADILTDGTIKVGDPIREP
jgi:MOSC domain-containing protein YiiM